MANWKVTDPNTGRTVTLTSEDNTPPTEQELEEVFAQPTVAPTTAVETPVTKTERPSYFETAIKPLGGLAKSSVKGFFAGIPKINVPEGVGLKYAFGDGEKLKQAFSTLTQEQYQPTGVAEKVAYGAGSLVPFSRLSKPFYGAAKTLPYIRKAPAIIKSALGLGGYEATKAGVEGKTPQEVLSAGLMGAGTGAVYHGAGRVGASVAPAIASKVGIPKVSGRVGSALGAAAAGGLTGGTEGAVLGGYLGAKYPSEPILSTKTELGKGIKKYQTSKLPMEERAIKQGFRTPEERVRGLEKAAKEKYTPLIEKEKLRLGARQERLEKIKAGTEEAVKTEKQKLSTDISKAEANTKQKIDSLNKEFQTAAERGSVEYARRLGELKSQGSISYGKHKDKIVKTINDEGGITRQEFQDKVINPAEAEIKKDLIASGKPLDIFENLKVKYGSGVSKEKNPELYDLVTKGRTGRGKGALDLSRVAKESGFAKQLATQDPNETLNIDELINDARTMRESMSRGAKGEELDITPEDRASTIYRKHWYKLMESKSPEFIKLQKAYKPVLEQYQFGEETFKPGSTYERKPATEYIKKVAKGKTGEITQSELARLKAIEEGTPEFTKGVGKVSGPAKSIYDKLVGAEKGGEIAKERITKTSELTQESLADKLLRIKGVSEKAKGISERKQAEISDLLTKRLAELETGKKMGRENIESLMKRKAITEKEKKIATGGGVATMADYLIRRIVARRLLR